MKEKKELKKKAKKKQQTNRLDVLILNIWP